MADSYPLPRIEDILVDQGKRTLYSVLDLKDAFHQVPLALDSRPLTCCSTPWVQSSGGWSLWGSIMVYLSSNGWLSTPCAVWLRRPTPMLMT